MAEAKKVEAKVAAPGQLARASEATDPAVHHLLAEIQSAQLNEDPDKVADLRARLAELGYE